MLFRVSAPQLKPRMDSHANWLLGESFRPSVSGRNLLQPQRQEFVGGNNNAVGIRRSVYASITWTRESSR